MAHVFNWPWYTGPSGMTHEYEQHLRETYDINDEEIQWIRSKQVDRDLQFEIMNAEQRSDLWHASRSGRLTASNYGSAAGHNKYCTPRALVTEMLWKSFQGNSATQWGVDHESIAADAYTRYMRKKLGEHVPFELSFPGLIVSMEFPWIGSSPDGFVWIDQQLAGGLEIKCPASRKVYEVLPPYYYDQIQGTMGFLKMKWWDVVIWTPSQMQVSRYAFDDVYFNTVLFPKMEQFYMKLYIKPAMLKEKGRLNPGKITEEADDMDILVD